MADETEGNYASINGLQIYYEVHGSGQPLVLLHGGFGGIDMFQQLLPDLARTRQVIGVELQGHGHTADIDRPLSFEQLADDVAALIEHLGLGQVDILGFSLGDAVALRTAIQHPDVVRKAVLVSTPYKRDGWYPEVRAGLSALSVEGFAGTPVYEAYRETSPTPEAWPAVVAKMRQLLTEEYDWAEGVAAIKAPVLLVVGDSDGLPPTHAVEFFGLLGGGKRDGDQGGLPASALAVLPSTTHAGWAPPFHGIITRTQLLLPVVTDFLDSPMPDAK